MAKKWISGAIKHPGALTRKADAAHKTVAEYEAHPPAHISTQTRREIALAETLKHLHKK